MKKKENQPRGQETGGVPCASFSSASLTVYKTELITHMLPTPWSFGEDQMGFYIWNHLANYRAPYKYKLLLIVVLIK